MDGPCRLYIELYENCDGFRRFAQKNDASPFDARQTHHIWGGKTRDDVPSNRLRLCFWVHDWFHQRPTWGRVASMWWRMRQACFDWRELDEAAGCDARGWVESQDDLPQPYARYAEEIANRVPDRGRGVSAWLSPRPVGLNNAHRTAESR